MKRVIYQIKPVLGELEMKVLREVKDNSSPRQVLERLSSHKKYAYTTIMTVLDRLYKKGFLKREKRGKTFYYSLIEDYETLTNNSLKKIITDGFSYFGVFNFINEETNLSLSYFISQAFIFFQKPILKTVMIFSSILLTINLIFHLYLDGLFDYLSFLFINPNLIFQFNLINESLSIFEFFFVTVFLIITLRIVFFNKHSLNRYQFKFF